MPGESADTSAAGSRKFSLRRFTGGALLVGIAALLILRDSGSGISINSAADDNGQSQQPPEESETSPHENNAQTAKSILSSEESAAISNGVLTVLIDGQDFLLRIPDEPDALYRPTELAHITALAPRATGDGTGVRVFIQRRETAQAAAETDLISALVAAGISRDAIRMPDQIVP